MSNKDELFLQALEEDCKKLDLINELIENLYFALDEKTTPMLGVSSWAKLARAYSIAKQLYEYDLVDGEEVENFVKEVENSYYSEIGDTEQDDK